MLGFFKSARKGRRALSRKPSVQKLLQRAIEPLESRQMLSTVPSGFSESLVANGLNNPTTMAFAPDGRIFVAEQSGSLKVIKDGKVLATPFVKIGVNPFGERGLLGVAFDPSFTTNHYVYVYYTISDGSTIHNRITRFTANGDVADPASKTILYDLDPLNPDVQQHNSGGMEFGPDGKLYVGVGENFDSSHAQDLSTNLGKILRLNPDGSVPTDNPFYNTSTTASGKAIWAYGFRNPFSMDIQPGTGRIFFNDVGYNTWEEIDDVQKGKNYGWPLTEGPTNNPAYVTPIYAYKHGEGAFEGDCIAGGAFYNPTTGNFPSQYTGMYFFADYGHGWIDYIDPTKPASSSTDTSVSTNVHSFATGLTSPVNLKVGPDGSLYYLQRGSVTSTTSTNGAIYKISYSSVGVKPSILAQPAAQTASIGQTATFTVSATGTAPLTYQWKKNGTTITGATDSSYTTAAATAANDGDLYSVVVTNGFGSVTSSAAKLSVLSNKAPTATITSPIVGATYTGGTVINFAGTATDTEDGALPASAYTWVIVFHHADHEHPFYPATSGIKSGSVTLPTVGETSANNVYYHIILTVTDSAGATFTTTRDVLPVTTNLTFNTAVVGGATVSGLQAAVDGVPFTDSESVVGVVGIQRELSVASPQTVNGVTYVFDHWSDNLGQTHTVLTPIATATTYTAFFKVSTTTVGNGLNAVYYDNKDFTGTSVSQTDKTLDFYWRDQPATAINLSTFSARWTGQLMAAKTETYNIIFRADDGVRVWLGGNLLIDQWHDTSGIVEYTKAVALTAGTSYDLKVEYYNNVGDGGARLFWSSPSTPRAIIPNSALFTGSGTVTPTPSFTSTDVGTTTPGSTNVVTEGSAYTITSAGSDIYSTSDQFRFVYESLTGDFDIKAKLSSLTNTNDNAKAGLMARETLSGNSRNVFAFATPFSYHMSVRASTNGSTGQSGSGSTSYPNVWLRLARVGNVFTAYRSTNGTTWTIVSTTTQVLPSTLLAGMAVTSHNTGASTTAVFTGVG